MTRHNAVAPSGGRLRAAGGPDPARYIVRRADILPKPSTAWDDPAWSRAETLTISRFHPRGTRSHGSDHTPLTQARLLHDGHALGLMFRVEDRYVLARSTTYQSPTHKDFLRRVLRAPPARARLFQLRVQRDRHAAAVVHREAPKARRQLREIHGGSRRHRSQYQGARVAGAANP